MCFFRFKMILIVVYVHINYITLTLIQSEISLNFTKDLLIFPALFIYHKQYPTNFRPSCNIMAHPIFFPLLLTLLYYDLLRYCSIMLQWNITLQGKKWDYETSSLVSIIFHLEGWRLIVKQFWQLKMTEESYFITLYIAQFTIVIFTYTTSQSH